MNRLSKTVSLLSFTLVGLLLMNCSKDDNDNEIIDQVAQFEKEIAAIDEHLTSNGIAYEKDPSGIRIVPTVLGTKLPAQATSQINVDYKGILFSTGTAFEEGTADGFVTDYIPGWQIALRKLPVGSKASIYIPSYYAYGTQANSKIPANSTLIFDITVKSATETTFYKEKFASDTTAIRKYLTDKSIAAVKDPNGFFYINQVDGTGATPSWFDQVRFKYTFTLLTDDSKSVGTFERMPSETFASFVVDHIHGVQVALQKMKVGGKIRLFLPSGLAFGINNATDNGAVVVPANSNVIVDLELLEVK